MKFDILYGYKGALCNSVTVEEDHGYIQAKNNFGEVIFRGVAVEFFRFMVDLSEGKFE